MMKGFFRLLDITLHNKEDYFTQPRFYCIPCPTSGVFKGRKKIVSVVLGDLIRLWTNGSSWKLKTPNDTYYIYRVVDDEETLTLKGYGWSVKRKTIVSLVGVNYHKLVQDLHKVLLQYPRGVK